MRSMQRLLQCLVVVTLTVGPGPAFAAIPSADGTYHGCYRRFGTGSFRLVDWDPVLCLGENALLRWETGRRFGRSLAWLSKA